MGDKTEVIVYCPEVFKHKVQSILKRYDSLQHLPRHFVLFYVEEVNYEELDEKEDLLIKAGIPCDFRWGEGDTYSAGTTSIRFTEEGELDIKSFSDNQLSISIGLLMEDIDNYEKLKNLILGCNEAITALPWDNQIEYSNIYLMKRLISG